ncbi:MAG: hypothetical protein JXQ73_30810 [Phycisphaerae bacterium]|nr:hypothetical protein [Phycisphaerae bacterium]
MHSARLRRMVVRPVIVCALALAGVRTASAQTAVTTYFDPGGQWLWATWGDGSHWSGGVIPANTPNAVYDGVYDTVYGDSEQHILWVRDMSPTVRSFLLDGENLEFHVTNNQTFTTTEGFTINRGCVAVPWNSDAPTLPMYGAFAGPITIGAEGILGVAMSPEGARSVGTFDGAIVNYGLFANNGVAAVTGRSFENHGEVDPWWGSTTTISVDGFSQAGRFHLRLGATVDFNVGTFNNNSADWVFMERQEYYVDPTLRIRAGTFNNNAAFEVPDHVNFDFQADNLTNGALFTARTGTLALGNVANSGALDLGGAEVTLTGTLANTGTATFGRAVGTGAVENAVTGVIAGSYFDVPVHNQGRIEYDHLSFAKGLTGGGTLAASDFLYIRNGNCDLVSLEGNPRVYLREGNVGVGSDHRVPTYDEIGYSGMVLTDGAVFRAPTIDIPENAFVELYGDGELRGDVMLSGTIAVANRGTIAGGTLSGSGTIMGPMDLGPGGHLTLRDVSNHLDLTADHIYASKTRITLHGGSNHAIIHTTASPAMVFEGNYTNAGTIEGRVVQGAGYTSFNNDGTIVGGLELPTGFFRNDYGGSLTVTEDSRVGDVYQSGHMSLSGSVTVSNGATFLCSPFEMPGYGTINTGEVDVSGAHFTVEDGATFGCWRMEVHGGAVITVRDARLELGDFFSYDNHQQVRTILDNATLYFEYGAFIKITRIAECRLSGGRVVVEDSSDMWRNNVTWVPYWNASAGASLAALQDQDALGLLSIGRDCDFFLDDIQSAEGDNGFTVGLYTYGLTTGSGTTLDLGGRNIFYVPDGVEVDGVVGLGYTNLGASVTNGEILPICDSSVRLYDSFRDWHDIEDDLGFEIGHNEEGDGVVDIVTAGDHDFLLRMLDQGLEGDNAISIAKDLAIDSFLEIGFDYRFLTDGQLDLLLGDETLCTVIAPGSGIGRDSPGLFSMSFSLAEFGLIPGDYTLTMRLSNTGSSDLLIDNLVVSSVPEPTCLGFAVFLGLAVFRYRRLLWEDASV